MKIFFAAVLGGAIGFFLGAAVGRQLGYFALGAGMGVAIGIYAGAWVGGKRRKAAEPGATDNPDDAQRLREDH